MPLQSARMAWLIYSMSRNRMFVVLSNAASATSAQIQIRTQVHSDIWRTVYLHTPVDSCTSILFGEILVKTWNRTQFEIQRRWWVHQTRPIFRFFFVSSLCGYSLCNVHCFIRSLNRLAWIVSCVSGFGVKRLQLRAPLAPENVDAFAHTLSPRPKILIFFLFFWLLLRKLRLNHLAFGFCYGMSQWSQSKYKVKNQWNSNSLEPNFYWHCMSVNTFENDA